MHTIRAALLAAVTVPSIALSQTRVLPRPEIGIRGGLASVHTKYSSGPFSASENGTVFSFPASPLLMPGGLHVMFFVSPKVSLEPQLGMLHMSQGGSSQTLTNFAAQVNWFAGTDVARAPYLFGQLGTLHQSASGGSSSSQTGIGGGIGYRRVYRESIALRYEARYRHWSGDNVTTNEIGALMGIAAVIR